MTPRPVPAAPELSVVVPVHDEEEGIAPLIEEIVAALRGRVAFEVLFVDDGSRDDTGARLRHALDYYPELRVLRHARQCGWSAALHGGVEAARGRWIATLASERRDDPAGIPRLLAARAEDDAQTGLYLGSPMARREGSARHRPAPLLDGLHRWMRDDAPQAGCGLALFARDTFLTLPYFDHMHRFLPVLMKRAGWRTVRVPVALRPRRAGATGRPWLQRVGSGLAGLCRFAWLVRRDSRAPVEEVRRG